MMQHHQPQGAFKLTVRMQRDSPNIPWGFRIQGGSEFPDLPLSIAKITPGSLSEEVGLQPGDIITAVGDPPNPAISWSHAQAEQVIRQCMDYLVLTVQRGGGRTWEVGRQAAAELPSSFPSPSRPNAASIISNALPDSSRFMGGPSTPAAPAYGGNGYDNNIYVQHSLAAEKPDLQPIGSSHNRSPRPFNQPGTVNIATGLGTPPIIHNTYNSPMGLYSADNAAQAFNAQATALLGGRSPGGISPTMQAVNQVDKYGDFGGNFGQSAQRNFEQPQSQLNPSYGNSGYSNGGVSPTPVRSVQAPQTLSPEHYQQPTAQVPKCGKCGSGIVGVFVRVRGQPLCVGCYTCQRCHIPLKNIGHFIVNDELYCEQHAKQATRPGYGGFQSQTVWSQ